MAPFPLSFDVAESSSKVATSARRSELNSAAFQSVGASNEARAVQQLRRELSQTVALSSPQTVSESELRAALPTLTASVWRDIVQERQLTRKCGYPLCSNAPSREYSSSPQQLKFTSNGKIVDVRERAPFCSVNCLRRSKFIERSSIPTKSSQLWEDVEPESKDKKGSTVSPALTEGAPPSSPDLIAHLPIIERPLSQDTPRARMVSVFGCFR